MPKIEMYMSDADKAVLKGAADNAQLKLATWCKAHLMLIAIAARKAEKDAE